MSNSLYSIITGTGSYIPTRVIRNDDFLSNEFYSAEGERLTKPTAEIVNKLQQITEIEERRYVTDDLTASDIGYFAAKEAIASAGIDPETLDYIIVAHNFGDVKSGNPKSDFVPTLAARVKAKLKIHNPYTVAYDVPFGCPGWLQALIHADYFLRSGDAKKILVIGTETLSRVYDPHDIDGMIYADGAGAVIAEAVESEKPVGILAHLTRSDTLHHAFLLRMDTSYNPAYPTNDIFIKMNGRKLYEYALNTVPQMVKDCIEKAGLSLKDISKVLIHQANAKMDDAILSRIFKLYNETNIPEDIMPMTIAKFGNNSVATVPILLDQITRGNMEGQTLKSGDYYVLASVGAGMNVNVAVYKMP